MKVFAFIIGVLSAALPAGAQTVTDAPSLSMIDLIAENGCSISNEEASRIFPAAGFTRKQARKLGRNLLDMGILQERDDRLVLVDDRCNVGGADMPPLVPFQEQYISILRHNGCQLMSGESTSLFPKYGMEAGLASELEEGLVNRGIAEISGGALRIGPAFCIADEAFADLPSLALTADEVHLVEVLEAENCSLVQSEIELTFPRDSMPADAAKAAVASLLASGAALAVEGGDRIWLSPAFCQPWSERKN